MRNKAFNIILFAIIKTVLFLVAMGICALIGFFGMRTFDKWQNKHSINTKSNATLDDVSKNLIYSWDPDKKKVTGCVLEILDTNTDSLVYITIPVNAQMELSNDFFAKLYKSNSEIPQIVKLSKLSKYYNNANDIFNSGVLILEEYFDMDISYYTVVQRSDFINVFKTAKLKTGHGKRKGKMLRYNFRQEASEYAGDKDSMEKYLEEWCSKTSSNLNKKGRLSFAENYCNVDGNSIGYLCLPTEKEGSFTYFMVDESKQLLSGYTGSTPSESATNDDSTNDISESTDTDSSDDKNSSLTLSILNSTGVAGLAAKWKDTLEKKGYNISKIGNYDSTLDTTRIIVSDEAVGNRLSKYFSDADIEIADVEDNADAQIIIGESDTE